MSDYRPLDQGRNEIRVLTLIDPSSSGASNVGLIECSLEHVSLDDYSDEYAQFLRIDGTITSAPSRALLWDFITALQPYHAGIREHSKPGSAMGDTLSAFSNSQAYLEDSFRNAKIYRWGDLVALSYEWGDPNDTAEIIVNGRRVSVTRNLNDCLQRISSWWHTEVNSESTRLWVDAVCINQGDIPERNRQVQRMQDVYLTAKTVLIMTGHGPENTEATETLLDEIVKKCLSGFQSEQSPREQLVHLISEENAPAWDGVFEIAGRSFWSRLWIIQEVLLATNSARICFGDGWALLNGFFAAVSLMKNYFTLFAAICGEDYDFQKWMTSVMKTERFVGLANFKTQGLEHPDLRALLATGRVAKQFDARDKIYGLLGLVDSNIRNLVVPDYGRPVADVYLDFAISAIKATGKIDLIIQGEAIGDKTLRLPSWAPDWSVTPAVDRSQDFIAANCYTNARAAGDTLHVYRSNTEVNELCCKGFKLDSLRALACTKANCDHDDHDIVSATATEIVNACAPYSDSRKVREAIWNTLTIGLLHAMESPSMPYLMDLPYFDGRGMAIPFFNIVDRFQQCNRDLVVAGKPFSSYFGSWEERFEEMPLDPPIISTLVFLMGPLLHRRLVVTERGYLGMTHKAAQHGDGIYILEGCNVPLVLRSNGEGKYHVIGECYVHEVMNGEAMKDMKDGKFQEEEIVLV